MVFSGPALVAALLLGLAQPYPVPDDDTVYGDGLVFETPEGHQLTTHQQQGADLVLPTGSVVAWDAFVVIGAQPFERTVEPGRYRVMLTLTDDDQHDKRVAFARVDFRDERAVRWEAATTPGADPASASYGVDSGTGAFMDAQVAEFATQNFDFYGNTMLKNLTDVVNRDEYWTSLTVDPSSGADAVAFTSGYGDGVYASYWGFNDNGEVVCLVTDFLVLNGTTRIQ